YGKWRWPVQVASDCRWKNSHLANRRETQRVMFEHSLSTAEQFSPVAGRSANTNSRVIAQHVAMMAGAMEPLQVGVETAPRTISDILARTSRSREFSAIRETPLPLDRRFV